MSCETIGTSKPEFSAGFGGFARAMAHYLSLTAAPTFALMAVIAAAAPADVLCIGMAEPFSLGGMVPMYVLMSAFHLAPWLRLVR
ncbi:hypothetical protein CI1B_40120 [Bradyrhizobium ivorense]|uniref:Uncharacterized protein n=1 Tax=Bradyrhizobium ivorense TaxID=2511166 RepID=A0A508TFX7_9BRAD|nr:hypothetical protein CI1B_40120 [Bradyrhizobium ivorense]VIO73621.1 hypothetical protein CI41S_37250 [Bradyrhizobium ivorense]